MVLHTSHSYAWKKMILQCLNWDSRCLELSRTVQTYLNWSKIVFKLLGVATFYFFFKKAHFATCCVRGLHRIHSCVSLNDLIIVVGGYRQYKIKVDAYILLACNNFEKYIISSTILTKKHRLWKTKEYFFQA